MKTCLKFLIVALLLLAATPALAQVKEIHEGDKVVFSFFRLARSTPDYETWIKNSDLWLSARDDTTREQIFQIEDLRLKWGFGTYDPKKDFIKIKTPITLLLKGTADSSTLSFSFPGANQKMPYFPFPYGKDSIAFIVNDMEKFLTVPLTHEEFFYVDSLLDAGVPATGSLELRLRAIKADASAPVHMDGIDQWMLLGETGSLELVMPGYDGIDKVLWSFNAPWYMNDSEKQLYPLLSK